MLLKGAFVHDGLGDTRIQDVLIENGRIARIAEKIDGIGEDVSGCHLLPGFVQAISIWGVMGNMTEIRPSSNDNDEHSNPITPELDGFYAFNGRAATAQQLGAFGLTCAGVAPTDNNLFGGTVAAFAVDGVNPYRMCLKRDIAMMASVTPAIKAAYGKKQMAPMTRMWIFTQFRDQLRKAAGYERKEGAPRDDKLIALKRVADGELPLFVACDSAAAVERVREILSEYPNIRLTLVNGFGLTGDEQWIIDGRVPIIARFADSPLNEDAMKLSWQAMAKFASAGVPVAISGAASSMLGAREDMLWGGAEMMRVLHDSDAVLPMLTSVPAKLLGLEDTTGAIREGLRADMALYSADPLVSWQAKVLRTWQAGEVIYREGDEMKCM